MADKRKILVTNALMYANGAPHLGHLVGAIQSDIWVRLQKMIGHDCIFVAGSDSHGTPIMIKAEGLNITPEQLITEMHALQLKDFQDFHIGFDNYYSTHSPENKALAYDIFEKLTKAGSISKRSIDQFYDPVKEMFLPDRYIKGECPTCHSKDQYGDNCEVCGSTYSPTDLIAPFSALTGAKPILKSSVHYFFELSQYADFLKAWIREGHVQREVANKLDEWFRDGLRAWDISRDAPYFGFLIPGETQKYFYVWLDAPIGYMASFKNYCDREKDIIFNDYFAKESKTELHHFIGKDILYFHTLFWPSILKGANYRTPTAVTVSGFLTIDGQKMSKSRGTLIKARDYLNHLNSEYLRYYYAAKLNNRIEDFDLQFDDFAQRVNADLVGKYVNIASRSANFINNYFAGELAQSLDNTSLVNTFSDAGDQIAHLYDKLEYSQAIRQMMTLADKANQYIDEMKPWQMIKDHARKAEVQKVCTTAINLFRLLTIYLKPVLPMTAINVEKFLAIPPLVWSDKQKPLLDHKINEYQPLMIRIDPKQIEEMKMESANNNANDTKPEAIAKVAPVAEEKADNNYISIDDFSKIDLRIAKVVTAELVEGADKLLRLSVDVGEEKPRQIFAGIKSAYQPEDLINKHVVVVANLAPRKMRFGISEGMVLVAGPGGKELWIVSPEEGAPPGSKVK